MDYSAAERERARNQTNTDWRDGRSAFDIALKLHMELNRAVELLGGLLEEHCCDDGSADFDGRTTECTVCKPVRDFLSHYPARLT